MMDFGGENEAAGDSILAVVTMYHHIRLVSGTCSVLSELGGRCVFLRSLSEVILYTESWIIVSVTADCLHH
jgi:hypothetical protein